MNHTNVEKKRNKYSKTKFYLVFTALIALLAGISHLWGLSPLKETQKTTELANLEKPNEQEGTEVLEQPEESDTPDIPKEPEEPRSLEPTDDTITTDSESTVFFSPKVWSYPECFNDSNATQLIAAEQNGIKPVDNRDQLEELVTAGQLTNISTSPYYIVEELTHSMPYLVPKAQLLLNTIGINFVDSLHSKGYELHLPVVTSVLRTAHDIKRLQQGNVNSVTNSCHCYGTTIDITYNRFMPLTGHTPTRYDDNLKKVLAEVLFDLKAQELCYVKYEKLQACFHLTVR